MIAIFLSFIGVFGYLAISGNSFVIMMTMMGIIALSGIVVNNGVVLLDYSEILLKRKQLESSNKNKKNPFYCEDYKASTIQRKLSSLVYHFKILAIQTNAFLYKKNWSFGCKFN